MNTAKKHHALFSLFNQARPTIPGHVCQYCGSIDTTVEDKEHFVELSKTLTLQGTAWICTQCCQVQYPDETAVVIQKQTNLAYKPGFLLTNQLLQ